MSKTLELTVAELLKLDEEGKLQYDQTTQRNFVYNEIKVVDNGNLTKAGDVIRSCLDGVEFPPLIFWQVTGEEEEGIDYVIEQLRIHDGKQRYLSFKYFLKPGTDGITVLTLGEDGKEIGVADLTEEEQDKLANYKFLIQVREGTLEEEEMSFYKLNTTAEPLTIYEGLRGAYHGTFLYEFENYINNLSLKSDPIEEINGKSRGSQAVWLLGLYFNLYDMKGAFKKDAMVKKLQDELKLVRNNEFDSKYKNFDKKVKFFIDLKQLKLIPGRDNLYLGLPARDTCKIFSIAQFVVNNNFDIGAIKAYYTEILEHENDVEHWILPVHKVAIESLQKGIKCDGRRFATKDMIFDMMKKSSKCSVCGTILTTSTANTDHRTPWSEGGRTVKSNIRLVCRSCNSIKGSN